MTTETIIAQVKFSKLVRRDELLTATAKLSRLGNNARPHFSVTGELHAALTMRGERIKGKWLAGGCIHDEISEAFPQLQPVIDLHLADDTGEPTHGEANGWYWLAGACGGLGERYHGGSGSDGKSPETCERIFADHIRDAKTARQIVAYFRTVTGDADAERAARLEQWEAAFGPRISAPRDYSDEARDIARPAKVERDLRKQWAALYAAMRPRFQLEANRALAVIRGLSSDFG